MNVGSDEMVPLTVYRILGVNTSILATIGPEVGTAEGDVLHTILLSKP